MPTRREGAKTMRAWSGACAVPRRALALGILLALATRGWADGDPAAAAATGPGESTASAPALAREPPRRILVESVVVEGTSREGVKRAVLGALRLGAGQEYTEREISLAVRRARHLPFVLDARPSLRRGSAPGRYLLVVVVEDHSPVSFGVMGDHWADGPERTSTARLGPSAERFLGPLTELRLAVETGARRQRLLLDEGTLESDDTPAAPNALLGLTRYDLAGSGSQLDLTLSAGRQLCTVRDFLGENQLCDVGTGVGLNLNLVVPLARSSSLALFAGLQRFDRKERVTLLAPDETGSPRLLPSPERYDVRTRRTRFGAFYQYDTTDDPLAAREGTRISAGLALELNHEYWRNLPEDSFRLLEDLPTGAAVLRVVRLQPLWGGFTLSAVAAPLTVVSEESAARGEASLGLRWVRAGRRNRYRLSLESGVIVAPWGTENARHVIPYSALRFRSSLLVVTLDVRWGR
jgi:hypothetical protein